MKERILLKRFPMICTAVSKEWEKVLKLIRHASMDDNDDENESWMIDQM